MAVALLIVWAADGGGYDPGTWYWGALVMLGLLVATVAGLGVGLLRVSKPAGVALAAFGLYVAWSYCSIAWAQSPGDALEGSNRALLYLIVFALFAILPWTVEGALAALLAFTLGVGVVALVILVRLATGSHVEALFIDGRLASPTGYYNSTAALFTLTALLSIALAARSELPALLRGALLAIACGGLQLALIGQSRGWLFTLPLVVIACIAVVRDRLRLIAVAVLLVVATLVPESLLLGVYQASKSGTVAGPPLAAAAERAGREALLLCGITLLIGWLLASWTRRLPARSLSARSRRTAGLVVVTLAVVTAAGGAVLATQGHPVRFVVRQWRGFSHPPVGPSSGSRFALVGTQRYDFWRVAWQAAVAHPVGGMGQDNFADYYVRRRRTDNEPRWTHSLELRLLTHTGFVGLSLFVVFIWAALTAALRGMRRADARAAGVAGTAIVPFVVWIVHGSVDWFWEVPALSGPALGFLGLAGALGGFAPAGIPVRRPRFLDRRDGRVILVCTGIFAIVAATVVLGMPYLTVREVARATAVSGQDPVAALRGLDRAAQLNPLSSQPGLIGGVIALEASTPQDAETRFRQAISREPGAWLPWLGVGLAESALGDRAHARRALQVAASINPREAVVQEAVSRIGSKRPLTPAEAIRQLRQGE